MTPTKRPLDNSDVSQQPKRHLSLQDYYDNVESHHLHVNSGSAKEFKESLDKEFPATHQPDSKLSDKDSKTDFRGIETNSKTFDKVGDYCKKKSTGIPHIEATVDTKKAAYDRIKTQVLSRINGRQRTELFGLKNQYTEIYTLLEHTITEGEGNSCLLIGPRSCGKSLIMDTALDRLNTKYKGQFITIRLSGFAQSDDKMALREICRQFDVELSKGFTQEEYEGLEKKSMSETLQSLIGLLDPPQSQIQDNDEELADSKRPVAVVIVLDEFDRFTQVSRQTLLYNLFDMAQSSHTPLAVIGVTSRMNTREMFEKRVRSRFSQRVFAVNRPKTMDQFWGICKSVLTINLSESAKEKNSEIFNTCAAEWNTEIETLYSKKDSLFYKQLERVFYTTKDVREFFDKLIYAIAKASPLLEDREIASYEKEQGISTSQHFIEGLSELELALLICSARVEIKFESDTFNFNVVYDEYLDVANKLNKERMVAMSSVESGPGGGYRVWSRDVARSAWERLENLDLILHVETPGSNAQGAITATATGLVGDSKATGTVRDDLKMAKVDVNLLEIREIIDHEHILRKWTRL